MDLGSGTLEVLTQHVRDLIDGIMLLQQLPNLQSDGIETEANPLLDIQQHGSVLGSSFSHAGCDHDVFGSNRVFHSSPNWTLDVAQPEHRGEYASLRECRQRNIFAAGIHAGGISREGGESTNNTLRSATLSSCA